MNLVHVRALDETHLDTLYRLLEERDPSNFISHQAMPSREQHAAFVLSRPFRYWYLIETGRGTVGALECLDTNELGVTIFRRMQGCGFGRMALSRFMATHKPLPAIPAKRNGHWLANIAPNNEASRKFFQAMGFTKIQETFRYG